MIVYVFFLILIHAVASDRMSCDNKCCAGYIRNSAFSQTVDTACLECPAGYACPYNQPVMQCANGQFSLSGASICSAISPVCAIGYYESVAPTPKNDRVCVACVNRCAVNEYIEGQLCTTVDRKRPAPRCTSCGTSCPTGFYLNYICDGTQNQINQCASCTSGGCSPGYYRSQCGIAADGVCTACKTCATGKFNLGCVGNTDGTCVNCTICGLGQAAVRECSNLQNRICGNAICSPSTSCGDLYCNYGVSSISSCNLQWQGQASPSTGGGWLCLQSMNTGTCAACPKGWTAVGGGGECVPCASGWSCDELGVPVQATDCPPNSYPVFVSNYNDIECWPCHLNTTALYEQSHAVLSRGGIYSQNQTIAKGLCAAYTTCITGYVLNTTSTTTSTTTQCVKCIPPGNGREFVSHGLTQNDLYSCISRMTSVANISNNAGFFGMYQTKCRAGYTSIAGSAQSANDCFMCPLQQDHSSVIVSSGTCAIECSQPFVLVGMACISHVNYASCDIAAGYKGAITDEGILCEVLPLPWNSAGTTIDNSNSNLFSTLFTLDNQFAEPVVSIDGEADLFASEKQIYLNGVSELCTISESISSPQDMPLVAQYCRTLQYHKIYMVKRVGEFVFVQLKRSFGNNNKYLMWKVDIEKQSIRRVWRLPGKVTSMTYSSINQKGYIYLVFADTPFVAYTSDDYIGCGTAVLQQMTGNGINIGRTICSDVQILAGVDTSGQADGLRDTARFESDLSIATGGDATRVFVLDSLNCRLAEIWIHYPGSWLTAVGTIVAKCFNSEAIPNGRFLTTVLNGAMLLFQADNGIWQVDTVFRDLILIIPDSEIVVDVEWIGANATAVKLWNRTHVQVITPVTTDCADGFFSTPGSACKPCARSEYSVGSGCLPCTTPTCNAGFYASACEGNADAQCLQCDAALIPTSPYRVISECTFQTVGPCPVGYFAAHEGEECTQCPGGKWGTTTHTGATSIRDCQCVMNGVLLETTPQTCQIASPYAAAVFPAVLWDNIPPWLYGLGCTAENALQAQQNTCDAKCLPDAIKCEPCGATGLFLEQVNPRICSLCPSSSVGLNGLFCQVCEGMREPTILHDACICKAPAVWIPPSNCACPPGYILDATKTTCVTCTESFIRTGLMPLSDTLDAPRDLVGCDECPAGFTSDSSFTFCVQCAVGSYREVGQIGCQSCATKNEYARDATNSTTCTTCSDSCAVGYRAVQCPINKDLFECQPCPALVFPQTWVQSATNDKCYWTCPETYFIGSERCMQCTTAQCAPGYKSMPCSIYADAHCDTPCFNATMPIENAHFASGCVWECDTGYKEVHTVYDGWVDFICIPQW